MVSSLSRSRTEFSHWVCVRRANRVDGAGASRVGATSTESGTPPSRCLAVASPVVIPLAQALAASDAKSSQTHAAPEVGAYRSGSSQRMPHDNPLRGASRNLLRELPEGIFLPLAGFAGAFSGATVG